MDYQSRKTYCRFCKKTVSDNELNLIGDITRQMLDALLLKPNFDVGNQILICNGCATKLQNAVIFKTSCLSPERKTQRFLNSEENSELVSVTSGDTLICHLRMEPLPNFNENVELVSIASNNMQICQLKMAPSLNSEKNVELVTVISDEQLTCHFCGILTEIGHYTYLDHKKEHIFLVDMVKKHIPELDYVTKELIACESCLASLQDLSNFIWDCTDKEERNKGSMADETNMESQLISNDNQDTSLKYDVTCDDVDIDEMEQEYKQVEDITMKNELEMEIVENEHPMKKDNLELLMRSKETVTELEQLDCERDCLYVEEINRGSKTSEANMESQLISKDVQNILPKYEVICDDVDIDRIEQEEDIRVKNEPEVEIVGTEDPIEKVNLELPMRDKETVVELQQLERYCLNTEEINKESTSSEMNIESQLQSIWPNYKVTCDNVDVDEMEKEYEQEEDSTVSNELDVETDGYEDAVERVSPQLVVKNKELVIRLEQLNWERDHLNTEERNKVSIAGETNMKSQLISKDIHNISLKYQVTCNDDDDDVDKMERGYEQEEDITVSNESEVEIDGHKDPIEKDHLELNVKKKELVIKLQQLDLKRTDNDVNFTISTEVVAEPFSLKPKRRYFAKSNVCIFCNKKNTKIVRHFQLVHMNEPEVKRFLVLPKNCSERNRITGDLRKRGNFKFNQQRQENDEIFVARKLHNRDIDVSNYMACPNCRVYLTKAALGRHYRKCEPNRKSNNGRKVLKASRAITEKIHHMANETLKTRVFPALKDGDIKELIRNDELLILYGNSMCDMYDEHQFDMIRNRLRVMAKFFSIIKSLDSNIDDFKSVFKPGCFEVISRALIQIGEYSESTGRFVKFTLPKTVGTAMKFIGKLYISECTKTNDTIQDIEDLMVLLRTDLKSTINKTSNKSPL